MTSENQFVISGVSGRLPECENVEKFWNAIFKGANLMTADDRRFPPGFHETPAQHGKIPHPEHFDASFFGFSSKTANITDPRHRVFLEVAYECIVDAGYNPDELRGSNTGVYIGISNADDDTELKKMNTDGYFVLVICLGMCANRTSYVFDFKGPSYICDNACSSSLYAFSQALADLQSGRVENALVGGAHICFCPHHSAEFAKLQALSPNGDLRPYCKYRNGYVRSDAVVAVFLQNINNCRRVYAEAVGAQTSSDGYKKEGITFPSYKAHMNLIEKVFREYKLNPNDVTYYEGHGTGTKAGDKAECQALSEFFGKYKKDALLLGSVKSNMGHSEITSGLCGVLKILATMRTGIIPGTINSEPVDMTLDGVKDGRIQIVTKNTPFTPGLVGISSLGFGGANAHAVFKPHPISTNNNLRRNKHRLVLVSGRTTEAVDYLIYAIGRNGNDLEFLALLDEVHKMNIDGHPHRGYIVLGDNPISNQDTFNKSRPIWFIYTGMGCQWTTMGRDLLEIEIFKKTFDRCAEAIKPYGIDLHHLITTDDDKIFDDMTNCFVAIAAIQIALTDVLYHMGIYPDRIVGHSLGEVACAYADGGLTPEQAVLIAYSRGYACIRAKDVLIKGLMAAVALSKEEITKILPEGIFVGCQNSSSSVTISGPEDITKAFVEKLQSSGIFAKEVKTGNTAFHTKYVHEAGKFLLEFLADVITEPQLRSPKWMSTSVNPEQASEEWALYNSPQYHYNNFCGPVLFEAIYEQIPKDAVVIEVAPHGLLQAILKRALPPTVQSIALLQRGSDDCEKLFLSNIGRLYLAGCQPQLRKLYPEVHFPVSAKTTSISSLIKWDHSVSWFTPIAKSKDYFGDYVIVDIDDSKWSYLRGHEIGGRVLMPATGYLLLVWRVFAKLLLKPIAEVPIKLERLSLKRATILVDNQETKFFVNILKKTGSFEIFESGSLVSTGTIKLLEDHEYEFEFEEKEFESNMISSNDFYKACQLKKYNYRDTFRCITEYDLENYRASIKWFDKFDCFLDGMMQMLVMDHITKKDLFLPSFIEKVIINPSSFLEVASKRKEMSITFDKILNVVKCEGIEICRAVFSKTVTKQNTQKDPLLEIQQFVYYEDTRPVNGPLLQSLTIALEIILQNTPDILRQLSICEIISEKTSELWKSVSEIFSKKPLALAHIVRKEITEINEKYDVILTDDSWVSADIELADYLNEDGFVIYRSSDSLQHITKSNLNEIYFSESNKICLLRKTLPALKKIDVVSIHNSDLSWMDGLKKYIREEKCDTLYLTCQNNGISGVIGFINCLNKERLKCKFRVIITDDRYFEDKEIMRKQMEKDLVINILKDKKWGTYVNLPLKEISKREVTDATIDISNVGDLTSLEWYQSPPVYCEPYEENEIVDIFYSALNSRDVMSATGKITLSPKHESPTTPSTYIGMEFSGLAGIKRVMGINHYGGLGLRGKTLKDMMWEIPDHWSLEDAATVPVVYARSYYALVIIGRLKKNESVLIHSGSGGTGMAAIRIALSLNCEIYTTVDTTQKKEYLKKLFPQLKEENIGNSTNTSFEKLIKKKTNCQGVDVVLNSLGEDLSEASVRCLSEGGRFLELEQAEFVNRTVLDCNMFLKGCSFHGVVFENMFKNDLGKTIHKLLREGMLSGVVKPLPRTVLKDTEVQEAFKLLAAGKNTGKILIQIRSEEHHMLRCPTRTIPAIPKVFFDPHKVYVITGGLGGVGLELTDWMIRKGARRFLLNSRSGITNGYQKVCLKKWRRHNGIKVCVSLSDSSNIPGALNLVSQAEEMAPIGGVFNLALVLRDKLFMNQTEEDFKEVFKAKWNSVSNLDRLTRDRCKHLDHFVVFSSISGGLGNPGQTNYGMANSALERLCEKRKSEGLPALAVEYGPIAEVGKVEDMNYDAVWRNFTEPQLISSCFNALEKFMLQPHPVGMTLVTVNNQERSKYDGERAPSELIAHILGIRDMKNVNKTSTMVQLGMDSLMSTEIKQILHRVFDIEMDTKTIQELTFDNLLEMQNTKEKPSFEKNCKTSGY